MRTLWTVISVLAAANLLAMAGFVGWLRATDRLNMERVREVRTVLSKTITQERNEAEEAEAKAEREAQEAERAKLESRPPLTAAERLAARVEATELDRQRAERLKREVSDLQRYLNAERAQLDADRARLNLERKAFDEALASKLALQSDEQFQKTLGVLTSLRPGQAVTMLKQVLEEGMPGAQGPGFIDPNQPGDLAAGGGEPSERPVVSSNIEKVVGYLDAMDSKVRVKVMGELVKTDPRLAADLLERLREHGTVARVP
jgi:hypothetical protein